MPSSDECACAACGRTFTKARSDAEALSDSRKLWGELPHDQLAVICDDCFQRGDLEGALREHRANRQRHKRRH